MVDANQSRFRLFLGEPDWRRFRVAVNPLDLDGKWRNLGEDWDDAASAGTVAWNPDSGSLILSPRTQGFKSSPHDAWPDLDSRRSAAADAFGNFYRLDETGTGILVTNSGDRTETLFWPTPPEVRSRSKGAFGPVAEPARAPLRLGGLAILPGHRLVAGLRGSDQGFLVFDLASGGPPLRIEWRHEEPLSVWDLSPSRDGRLTVLDRLARRLWTLDPTLDMYRPIPSGPASPFRPSDRSIATTDATSTSVRAWSIAAGHDPVAVERLPDGSCLVLERRRGSFGRIARYRNGAFVDALDLAEMEGLLAVRAIDDAFKLQGHDMVLDSSDPERLSVVVASEEGNQCWRVALEPTSSGWKMRPVAQELPMRRFDGTELAQTREGPFYVSDGIWVPLVELRRRRYAATGTIEAPRMDGRIPGTVWHRVVFDGQVPPGSSVKISVRCADTEDQLSRARFSLQPSPVLRASGPEIPWGRMPTDSDKGIGTWELLLQSVRGRFLELRVHMECDEMRTPAIHALRIWDPRFSYVDHYLPPVYREDEPSRDFLERFLANFEGMFTALEDRIVRSTCLYDVRTAPPETLDWLAGWLGLVFDHSMDDRRRRLLLRHAPTLFAYRGTPQAILLALRIALSETLCDADFDLPAPAGRKVFGLRLVEQCTTRGRSPAFSGQTVSELATAESVTGRWSLSDGRPALMERWSAACRAAGIEPEVPFAPVPPQEPGSRKVWEVFCHEQLGAIPRLASDIGRARDFAGPRLDACQSGQALESWNDFRKSDRLPMETRHRLLRWQGYLRRRWGRIEALRAAWSAQWPDFESIAPFEHIPVSEQAFRDWAIFETFLEPVLELAHRFRVLVPTTGPLDDRADFERTKDHARRIVALEKPAHTVFDIQPYWALFRVGQARLGVDSALDEGSRSERFAPWIRIGTGRVGASRVAERALPEDRIRLELETGRRGG